jgi:sortase A
VRYTAEMARAARIVGGFLMISGVLTATWAIAVWQWQDPFTSVYTHWQQHELARSLDRQVASFRPTQIPAPSGVVERRTIAAEAFRYRRAVRRGQAIGRIVIGRIGLKMVLVNGTDHDSLTKGPGRDPRSYMPGQNRLVYIAGHRTTYSAPFGHINDIRRGDVIRLEMPYATFTYRALRHRIVSAHDMSVLRSPRHELLELQACHPRFFATHRYIVYARLASVAPRDGTPYRIAAARSRGG